MLFRIIVSEDGAGWSVVYDGAQLPGRALGRLADGALAFPLPPPEDPPLAGTPEAALLADALELRACFRRLARQQPGPGDVERFGRYLFHTLIGPVAWRRIVAAAAGQPFELALCWDVGDRSLARLPWELMACPDQADPSKTVFLVAHEPQVAITRRVPGAAALPAQLQSPPRVLFAVGTGLSEQAIRPGAEYLGLLRALEVNGLRLRHHLLAEASPERLKAALAAFKPTILHVICHGGVFDDSGEPFLELRNDKTGEGTTTVKIDELFEILAAGPEVEIVVLNACYTAAEGDYSPVGQVALPLAAALVKGNGVRSVPVVVGMAGEVGDRACRLFTRRFYESLLTDGLIAQATAHGRRLGVTNPHSEEWRASVDWALPTLFLPASAGEVALTVVSDADERQRHRDAYAYSQGEYPVFCGREAHFDAYAALMGDDKLQALSVTLSSLRLLAGQGDNTTFSALAIGAEFSNVYRDADRPPPRLGLTWLLGELAATAFRDGHLPVFVSISKKDDPQPYVAPKSPQELLDKIMEAAEKSAGRLGLLNQAYWEGLDECLSWSPEKPRPAVLSRPEFQNRQTLRRKDPNHVDVLAEVFWLGVRDLLEALRQSRPEATRANTRVLLIVDDVERMEENTASFLFTKLLPDDILRARWFRDGVRAIVGYTRRDDPQAKGVYSRVIESWEKSSGLIAFSPLAEFDLSEGRRAYRHFLFGWREYNRPGGKRMPQTYRTRRPEEIERQMNSFHEYVTYGAPSYLLGSGMRIAVQQQIGNQQLIDARDDDLINGQAPARGGT